MKRRIVIVGFMGCGKTTVAQALAVRLSCEVIDLDSFIAEREGKPPAEIIQRRGEPAFRDIETRAVRDVLEKGDAQVIALGGGAWTVDTNRAVVNEHDCVSVWLDAPFDVCWQRIQAGGHTRPLAQNRAAAGKLYESRSGDYQLSTVRIQIVESDTAETVADKILTKTGRG